MFYVLFIFVFKIRGGEEIISHCDFWNFLMFLCLCYVMLNNQFLWEYYTGSSKSVEMNISGPLMLLICYPSYLFKLPFSESCGFSIPSFAFVWTCAHKFTCVHTCTRGTPHLVSRAQKNPCISKNYFFFSFFLIVCFHVWNFTKPADSGSTEIFILRQRIKI